VRGAFDADRRGDVALHRVIALLEGHHHEPLRKGTAGLGQRVVEGTAHDAVGVGQLETDRFGRRLHARTLPHTLISND